MKCFDPTPTPRIWFSRIRFRAVPKQCSPTTTLFLRPVDRAPGRVPGSVVHNCHAFEGVQMQRNKAAMVLAVRGVLKCMTMGWVGGSASSFSNQP